MSSRQIFRFDSNRCLVRCSENEVELPQSLDKNSFPCWVDISARDAGSLKPFLESAGAHPLAIEACLDPVPASLMAVYGKSLFIAIPACKRWDSEKRTFLWVICLPGTIITIHEAENLAVQKIIERYTGDGMRFHSQNTSAILYQIFDHVIDEDMAFTLKTRDMMSQLQELIDEDPDDRIPKKTLHLKRQLTRLAATFEDQIYCVSSLQTIESESFSTENLHDYFRDAFLHLEHASRMIGRQLAHLNSIEYHYQLSLQNKTNNRLWLLTVMSTIFLPLTLLTGIYGMNFKYMPELAWPWGYPGTLGLMLTIAGGMLWQFYRRGWFD